MLLRYYNQRTENIPLIFLKLNFVINVFSVSMEQISFFSQIEISDKLKTHKCHILWLLDMKIECAAYCEHENAKQKSNGKVGIIRRNKRFQW